MSDENEYAPYSDECAAYAAYDEMLDDVYGHVEVAGFSFDTSTALKELSPITYRVGFNDWLDSVQDD